MWTITRVQVVLSSICYLISLCGVVFVVSCVGIALLPTIGYGSVSTNLCLMSWWVCCLGHVMFKWEVVILDGGARVRVFYLDIYYYGGWICFITRSNIGLCMSVKVSFICSFCLLESYMWNRLSVFSN
jgi:hypothetical protein